MRALNFWKSDWFLGVMVTLLIFIAANGDLIQSLERKAYDLGMRATVRAPSDKIAIIAIDDHSIANIGRWPWSREVHAKLIDGLSDAKAKVIAYGSFFFEPQLDPGLAYINKLLALYAGTTAGPTSAETGAAPGMAPASGDLEQFGSLLREAEETLNADRKLAESIKRAGNVLLPLMFQQLAEPQGKPDRALPDYVAMMSLATQATGDQVFPTPGVLPQYPIPELGANAVALGHLNSLTDVDGAVRAEALLIRHYDRLFPSLAVMAAAGSLNLKVSDIVPVPGEEVLIGRLRIRTDPELRMFTFFYGDRGGRPAFDVDSFHEVLSGKVSPSKYRDKIVLIGPTAAGLGSTQVTPVSPGTAPVFTMAHTVSSILKEHFFIVPTWALWAEKLVFLAVALYLVLLLPRLRAGPAAAITVVLAVSLVTAHFVLMTTQLLWLQFMASATLLLTGHLALTTKHFLVTERGKERADIDLAQSHRMLGLGYQGQGQLDTAFDYFRKLPVDEGVLDLLYNLGLDYERKRQFNKAESVFRYIAEYNRQFRDVESRLTRAKAMSETVILGGTQGHPGGTVILPGGGVEKPMLGRYQVEKELGKGAMGVVYLGKDPKIGRVVAIKTMALSQEFEADELTEVKERFFREAETAGRLAHPNIVTIYDAGEEHDLAYIAMEFLKGKDLVAYTKPDNLLALPRTLSIVARVAEALAYAHQNNVVHRDIKPANIMYEPEGDMVKVTDFGIARITDSSRTKTGMVLGTPSYMSPEQLAGQKIEGRSDVFSLGVMLYQLASGNLPFRGESMAQLMFKIANEPHEDIRSYQPALPACVVAIVNKALAKNPDDRYQSAEVMAKALRLCLEAVGAAAGKVGSAPTSEAGHA